MYKIDFVSLYISLKVSRKRFLQLTADLIRFNIKIIRFIMNKNKPKILAR